MFQVKLMDNTQVEIFIDNRAMPSILPLSIYNKYPILQKYPRMKSHTPIPTGGMIESHQTVPLNSSKVMRLHILMPDQRA